MRILKIFTIIYLFLISFLLYAEEDPLIGTWEISIITDSEEQFPWWKEIKYPKILAISKTHDVYSIIFTDQFDYTCNGQAMGANVGLELVFEFCGGLGTKSPNAWSPIHHAKIVEGKLHGVVTTNQYLFKWVGVRK